MDGRLLLRYALRALVALAAVTAAWSAHAREAAPVPERVEVGVNGANPDPCVRTHP